MEACSHRNHLKFSEVSGWTNTLLRGSGAKDTWDERETPPNSNCLTVSKCPDRHACLDKYDCLHIIRGDYLQVKGRHRGLPLRKPPFPQTPNVGVTPCGDPGETIYSWLTASKYTDRHGSVPTVPCLSFKRIVCVSIRYASSTTLWSPFTSLRFSTRTRARRRLKQKACNLFPKIIQE